MLKIRDDVDLKELEKYGFEKQTRKGKTHKYEYEHGKEEYYTEILWIYDDGINTIEILEKRENSDWKYQNEEKEVYVYENDYDMGISKYILGKLYDLIKANLVVKE